MTVWPEAVHQAAGVGLCEHVGARSEFASILSARVQKSDALLIVVVAILRLVPSSSSRLLARDQGSCLGLASAVVLVLAARLRPGLLPRSRVGFVASTLLRGLCRAHALQLLLGPSLFSDNWVSLADPTVQQLSLG